MAAAEEQGKLLPERQGDPDNPREGDAATYYVWTDSHACTIVLVAGRFITLRRDKATLAPGASLDDERYLYEPDLDGELIKVSRRPLPEGKHVWKRVGQRTRSPGGYASLGVRCEHRDRHF